MLYKTNSILYNNQCAVVYGGAKNKKWGFSEVGYRATLAV